LLLLGAFPAILVGQTGEELTPPISLFQKEFIIKTDSVKFQYPLPDSILIPKSEKVVADSLLLEREKDYTVDYWNGVLKLHDVRPNSTVTIHYQHLPVSLRREYFHREMVIVDSSKAGPHTNSTGSRRPQPKQVTESLFPSTLQKSGSIIRGVSVGSGQGLRVDSGLRLQMAGKLTDNVEVVASLTDQNTPIQPEGNTQTLQEIDKVFVQLKGPNVQATLGDYNLNLGGTQFTNYNRKLEGIKGESQFRNTSVTLSGAVSRGQFATNEFMGQEGNQGPYQLRSPEGQINIIVLAGTERVWVDGELMTRGESHDYVIEYGNGQITFTRNRLITSDSRITVDFQFSDESFQRNYWTAQGKSEFMDGKIRLGTTFIRESDNQDNPLRFALSDASLQALETAGDSVAVVPGDTLVGMGNGAYLKDSTGVFTYVGPGNGDHNVNFSFFGANQGNYRNIGLGRYEFVGENQGSYRPFILLPKAQRHDVVGLNLGVSPTSFLNVDGEVAFSQFDANLYSARNDGDNQGTAYHINLDLQPQNLKLGGTDFGRFDLNGVLRSKSVNYRDVDRSTIAEFDRRWDIPDAVTSNQENIQELHGRYQPVEGVAVSGGIGRLSKSSDFSSERWDVRTVLDRGNLPKMEYFVEFIDREAAALQQQSTWLRHRGSATYRLQWLQPIFQYEGEIKKESLNDTTDIGFRFDSYTTGLTLSPWKSLTASAKYNFRDDRERFGDAFVPESEARTQSYSLDLRNWHALSATASFTHRERSFDDPETQDTRTDLADLRIGYAPRNSGVRSNLYYQISTKQVARQEEVFEEVEPGEGNFRFNEELGEFEPDPFGDFIRRIFATDDFIPVVELRMRTDLRLEPKQFLDSRLLNPVTTETFVRIDERTREQNVAKIYLLNLDHFQQDTTTIFGSIELRQDIHLWEKSRKFSLRYRFRNRRELNNQFIDGGQKRSLIEHRLRSVYQLTNQISSQLELSYGKEDRLFQTVAREDRQVRSAKLDLDLVYRPNRQFEFGLKSLVSRNRDVIPEPNTEANLFSFAPRLNYSLSQKGRLRTEIEWTRVNVAPNDRLIPFELTEGKQAGSTYRWNVAFDYRVSQNVQASLSYFGRNEPNRPKTQHIAKVEMRAFF